MSASDYVIVGSGAAGCVLANRLSEDPNTSVVLLEAGGSHRHPFIDMPKGLAKIMVDPERIWAYQSEPEQGNGFQPEVWARGRVVGGSTSINGMMYVRGQPADFNEISRVSGDDWSWNHIAAAYRSLEAHELGADATRGDSGPLRITMPDRLSPLTEAMIRAGVEMGLPRKRDVNAPDDDVGVGYAPRTIYKGRRQSAATAFLDPISHRPNLKIVTHALVDKVNFQGRRATEVAVIDTKTKERRTFAARRAIILAAGAMASPGILQRSGIGPGEVLQALGIPIVHESPNVGRGLREHRGIIMQWKLKSHRHSDNVQFSGWRLARNVMQYFLSSNGPMSSASYEVGLWLRSRAHAVRPDVQFLVAPFSFDFATQRMRLEPFPGMNIVGYPLRPSSCGELHIKSVDPAVLPSLRPNYGATAEDRELMVATVRLARQYAGQPAFREWISEESFPGPACASDQDVLSAFERSGTCGYHAVGTCRMGADAKSVVDSQLRVRGVEGLRVMDTSVMPQIPAGNTNGPTMAMAWRAADIIRRG